MSHSRVADAEAFGVASRFVLVFEPCRVCVTHAVRQGRVPLWSRLNCCGSPILAALAAVVAAAGRVVAAVRARRPAVEIAAS